MVDKLNRAESVNAANISRFNKSGKSTTAEAPKVSRTLINEIIYELRAEKNDVTTQAVQHKVIVKTLMANFGFAATTEPKFKKLYDHIMTRFKKDETAQKMIEQAIERYAK